MVAERILFVEQTNVKAVRELEAEILSHLSALPQQSTSAVRAVRREYSRKLAQAPAEIVIELALRLVGKSGTMQRFFGCELLQFNKTAFLNLNAEILQELSRGMNNWAAVDIFACYLAGPAWREQLVTGNLIKRWARSKDRWLRRAALVSTVPLNNKARGGSGDRQRTLEICKMLIADRDDMVVKALSWALRELAKRDSKCVQEFVTSYRNVLAARVVREVGNKLHTGLKNPRKD